MRQIAPGLLVLSCFSGCAPLARSGRESTPPAKSASLVAPSAQTGDPSASLARTPQVDPACGLSWTPREVGTVVRIPASMMARAMKPAVAGLCACTRPGEFTSIVVRIDFANGTAETRAPDESGLDACLTRTPGSFEGFPEAEHFEGDCIGCGPKRYGVFGGGDDPPKDAPGRGGLRLTIPFLVDRSNEVLACAVGSHAAKGRCVPDDAPPMAGAAMAPACACSATDLHCQIVCAVR